MSLEYYDDVINTIESEEILKLVRKANALSDPDSYDKQKKNVKAIIRILKQILKEAEQRKEWLVFFDTFYNLFHAFYLQYDWPKIILYAEKYFQYECYMEQVVLKYPAKRHRLLFDGCYGFIFKAYVTYPQINDEKMEAFMKKYEYAVKICGVRETYDESRFKLAFLYRDAAQAQEVLKVYLKHKIDSCYLCAREPVLVCYLLSKDYETLEYEMEQIRNKQIPKQYRWCYRSCHYSNYKDLVGFILEKCIIFGDVEYFHTLLERYKDIYQMNLKNIYTEECCHQAYLGQFSQMAKHIETAEGDVEDGQDPKKQDLDYLEICLYWHCYFILLHRSGKEEVATTLTQRVTGEEKEMCSTVALADFFEKEADRMGVLFDQSRKQFRYQELKKYWEMCYLQ